MKAMCLWCQVEFYPNRDWQRFCSTGCQQAWNRHERKRMEVIAADAARERRLNGPRPRPIVEPEPAKFVKRI
jgi:hypothetical protein